MMRNPSVVEPPVFAFEEGSYEVNETAGTVRIGVVKQSGEIISGESVTLDVTPRQGSGQIRGAGVYFVCTFCVFVCACMRVCVRTCVCVCGCGGCPCAHKYIRMCG